MLSIDVRVDCYKNGKIMPISYINTHGVTKYIRGIKKIKHTGENYSDVEYYCNVEEELIKLILKNNKWYIIEN